MVNLMNSSQIAPENKKHIKSEVFNIAKQCINAGKDETVLYLNKILELESK